MSEELKPCPFCGGKAAFEYARGSYGYYPAKMRVKCGTKTCLGQTQYFPHGEHGYDETPVAEAKAVAAWNTRADSDIVIPILESDRIEAQAAEIDRLVEVGAKQAFEVGVLREALNWMADSEPLVVEAILTRARAALGETE